MIYFYSGETMPVYVLLAYAKSGKTDLSPPERRAAGGIVAAIKHTARKKR